MRLACKLRHGLIGARVIPIGGIWHEMTGESTTVGIYAGAADRATTATVTRTAPAFRKILAASLAVAPVVTMSSIKTIWSPRGSQFGET